MKKIAVAVSGGADSLYTLLLLQEQNIEVQAIHAVLFPNSETKEKISRLQQFCISRNIPLRIVDLSEEFQRKVVTPFINSHYLARTPNPCALCNRVIKFGKLMSIALENAELYSTGHYVALEEHTRYGKALRSGSDTIKDQSYFLALVPSERLKKCIFPLGNCHKTDILSYLNQHDIALPAPGESQEICFIPDNDHCAWLENAFQRQKRESNKGDVILADENRIIASHNGLWHYTEGQRRGLGIPWKAPLYVLKKDPQKNVLIVGTKHFLPVRGFYANAVNCMIPTELWPKEILVRVRYHQRPTPCQIILHTDSMEVRFLTPQDPPAPGQIAALYDSEGFVLGGGIIGKVF